MDDSVSSLFSPLFFNLHAFLNFISYGKKCVCVDGLVPIDLVIKSRSLQRGKMVTRAILTSLGLG